MEQCVTSAADPGVETFGRYRLVKRIAVGGMGEIFLARYINAASVECLAVVKRMIPRLTSDPDFINYFLHEGRISSLLNHPNIVHTLELGKYEGRYFMAMEYIPGATLVRLLAMSLASDTPFSIPLVIHLSSQIASALSYIHSRKDLQGRPFSIIHMDLAPHNMLVTPEGHLKVLDFGISRANGLSLSRCRRDFRGRTAYLAPEQLQDLVLDQRLDIFAMGVIMHEMIAGRPLFRTRDDRQTVNRILYAPIPRPRRLRPDCPEMLERIILKALTRDRDKRYHTAEELLGDLDRCIEAHGILVSKTRSQDEVSWLLGLIEEQAERQARGLEGGTASKELSISITTTSLRGA